ncbi:LysR family transcriptional regulator [Taklimakanibacter deserti]|uniref:LysR family transcriptional regulator n=1 Tax=Taklimakanibacter deserti TaxID=2267839 RepID=UPI0013C43FA2
MDFRKLNQFLVVAESGSISRAAERLHIAQPALTHAMKSLEDDLGIQLLERHARGVLVTDLGKVLEDQARVILREVERTREILKACAVNPVGNVRIALPSLIAGDLTVPFLKRLSLGRRKFHITLIEREAALAEEAVKTGQCDAALTFSSAAGTDVTLQPLLAEELAALLPPPSPVPGTTVSITDLVSIKLALLPKEDPVRLALDQTAVRHAIRLDVPVEVSSWPDLCALIKEGYATVLPASMAKRISAATGAELAWLSDPRITCALSIMTAKHRNLSRAALAAVEDLARTVEELVNDGRWVGRYIGNVRTSAGAVSVVAN